MIQYYEWLPIVEGIEGVENIENELAIFRYSDIKPQLVKMQSDYLELMHAPHKFDFFMIVQHLSGTLKFSVDMEEYEVKRGYNMIHCAPGQILSIESMSADFDAEVLIMSQRFIGSMLVYLNGSIPFRFDMCRNAVTPFKEHEMRLHEFFIKAVRNVLADVENPYRMQVVQHAMMAIFYSSNKMRDFGSNKEVLRTNADVLSKQFMALVKEHFREERQLQFYANAMCITPRYLSRVVKECTGSSAADWIERYVVLEASALLKSTTMTIQQISDGLNFPSQTFFGKYFKRRVGMSPKEYRRVG